MVESHAMPEPETPQETLRRLLYDAAKKAEAVLGAVLAVQDRLSREPNQEDYDYESYACRTYEVLSTGSIDLNDLKEQVRIQLRLI